MRGLAASLRLDGNRKRWPNWLFRSDHVENAAAILNSGKLLSRAAAQRSGLIVKDSGSPRHVGQLSAEHRSYVRLYFRPRTPTQYRNEGIRPAGKIELDAHMPVPVYLLFSSSLLMESDVEFTRGRLTHETEIGNSVEFLRDMAFSDIYHDRGVGAVGGSDRRSEILNARHSEVVVKDELQLEHAKHIVCRSAPERETLVSLLNTETRKRWTQRIHVDEGRGMLFYKRGTFVQSADLSENASRFVFYSNGEPAMRGPFHLRIEWEITWRETQILVTKRSGRSQPGALLRCRDCCPWREPTPQYTSYRIGRRRTVTHVISRITIALTRSHVERCSRDVRFTQPSTPPPGNGPAFMKAFSTLAVTVDALLSQPPTGSAWPQAMELADHTAPSLGVVK